LRILLALNALVAGLYVYSQLNPRVYEGFKPSAQPLPRLSVSGRRLQAEVKALGGTARRRGRTQPVLGFFGRSRALVFVRLDGKEVGDEPFARLMENYGDDLSGLDIRNTRITDRGLGRLKGLTNIQDLALGNVDPRQFPPGIGVRLPVTAITDAGLVHLKGLTQLASLDLSGLPVTDAGLVALKELPNLERLYLGRTKVKGPGLGRLKSLPRLSLIDLDDSAITDEGLSFLAGASTLEFLSLKGVPLTGRGLKSLQALPRLQTLQINGCGLLDEEVMELGRSNPGLEIERR
jgi:hypothetical protein